MDKQVIHCTSTLEDNQDSFSLAYDKLVIAPGALSNTFGVEGVKEHAVFLKDIPDARRIRARIVECFEVRFHLARYAKMRCSLPSCMRN